MRGERATLRKNNWVRLVLEATMDLWWWQEFSIRMSQMQIERQNISRRKKKHKETLTNIKSEKGIPCSPSRWNRASIVRGRVLLATETIGF